MKAKIFLNRNGSEGSSSDLCNINIDFVPFEGLTFWIDGDMFLNACLDDVGSRDTDDSVGLYIDMISYTVRKNETIMNLWVTDVS